MKIYTIYSYEDGDICKVEGWTEAKNTILEFYEIDAAEGINKRYYLKTERNEKKNDKKRKDKKPLT